MSNKGRLLVFSAPSGSGKTTLITMLMEKYPVFEFSISATTRNPRGTEKNGVEYFFLSEEDFNKKIVNKSFVEHKLVYGNRYGTLKTFVERSLKEGSKIIFDVDVKGALSIKEQYPEDSILIFIYPPSPEELKKRLKKRGTDSPETIEKRLSESVKEMEKMNKYDYLIENDDLKKAYNELEEILKKEKII